MPRCYEPRLSRLAHRDCKLIFDRNTAYSRWFLYRFVLGIVFIIILVWWTFAPSAGEREFRRAQEALTHVTSWKEEVPSGNAFFEEQMEVSCFDHRAHLTRQSRIANGGEYIQEETRVGTASYARTSARFPQSPMQDFSMNWQNSALMMLNPPCGKAAATQNVYYFPEFDRLIRTAVITKGNKDYVHGAVCRDWKAHVVIAHGMDDEVICIGTGDHLPYRLRKGSTSYVLYDWNVPVSIEQPAVLDQPKSVPYYYQQYYQQSTPTWRTSDYRPQNEPPMQYISPTPPPLPMPAVPPPPPPPEEEENPNPR